MSQDKNAGRSHGIKIDNSSFDRVEQFKYRGVDKSLARPGREQATATEDFDVHISYL
jgi:hypothetical protein